MESLTLIRWIIGAAALGAGALISLGNWITLVNLMVKKGSTSFVPLIGGCLAVLGISLIPLDGRWSWIWVPLVADWGCIPMWSWVGIAEVIKSKNEPETGEQSP